MPGDELPYVRESAVVLLPPKNLESKPLRVMGQTTGFPQRDGVGRMYVGNMSDDKFSPEEIITWKNTRGGGKPGKNQTIGWKEECFSGQKLRISFWIKFMHQVPPAQDDFGIMVGPSIYNNFVGECKAKKWHFVEQLSQCGRSRKEPEVLLLFDAITEQQTVHISQFRVQVFNDDDSVRSTFCAIPSSSQTIPIKVMGRYGGFPQNVGVGRMQVGDVVDNKFRSDEIITWNNTHKFMGKGGPYQWLGWQSTKFARQTLRVSFWVKFVERVPVPSSNFGISLYGEVFNDWMLDEKIESDQWHYVEQNLKCGLSGDFNHVVLKFDSIPHEQVVRISQLRLDILSDSGTGEFRKRIKRQSSSISPNFSKPRPTLSTSLSIDSSNIADTFSVIPSLSPSANSRPKVMGKFADFPRNEGVGRMYVGDVEDVEEKFPAEEVITWENTYGCAGGNQWVGWEDVAFANQKLRVTCWVKFVEKVPEPSHNFGIKVYGVLYNNWLKECTPDTWHYVERTVKCRRSGGDEGGGRHGDGNYVVLIFDSIQHTQTVRMSQFNVEILTPDASDVDRTYTAITSGSLPLPKAQLPLRIMDRYNNFPVEEKDARMYVAEVIDDTFRPEQIITYDKTSDSPTEYHSIGWMNKAFSDQILRISFWVKFVKQVPVPSRNFGVKVFGKLFNNFVQRCHSDEWYYVEKTVKNKSSGDSNKLHLIFDSIDHNQTIRIAEFKVEILKDPTKTQLEFQLAETYDAIDAGWRQASVADVHRCLDSIEMLLVSEEDDDFALLDGTVSGPKGGYQTQSGNDAACETMIIVKGKQEVRFKLVKFKRAMEPGWRLATVGDIESSMEEIKEVLSNKTWHICGLQDGKIGGAGYEYELHRVNEEYAGYNYEIEYTTGERGMCIVVKE